MTVGEALARAEELRPGIPMERETPLSPDK